MASRYPRLSRKDLEIADAAVRNGFDSRNFEALQKLIKAVKFAARPKRNCWRRPYTAGLYPDRWRPSTVRPRPGLVEAYQTSTVAPAAPSFTKSVAQIIEDVANLTKTSQIQGKASQTGVQRELEPGEVELSTLNKKRGVTVAGFTQTSATKRTKTGLEAQQTIITLKSREIIDLTKEENMSLTTATAMTEIPVVPQQLATAASSTSQQTIRRDTTYALRRCADRFKSFIRSVGLERESLRERWDIDEELKLQTVTDELAKLNNYFSKAEDMFHASIDTVENLLAGR